MPGHIAVDPKEFPYGTELYVVSADGSYVYGYCIAADTGGFVKMGNTDIDLYMANKDMCYDWGNREVIIYVL
jgi:3D (Asp-Asp-Asp) domain-containing protein